MATSQDNACEHETPSPVQEKSTVFSGDDAEVDAPVLLKDGFKMHPQPTSDPLDPLNWSWVKKHSILAIVMSLYFMFTYITTTTVPAFPDLQEYYGISLAQVNWTVAIPALGLAVGPLIWSSLADIYGRRLIFIIGTVMAFASTIGAAKAPTYAGYMAARFFQGLGVAPASTVGLAIINDMFYEHERGQKVGLWVLAIDMGLLVGPLIGGFIWLVDQFWIQWLSAIFFGVILAAEIAFLPETLYPRNQMLHKMPFTDSHASAVDVEKADRRKHAASEVSIKRTTQLPFINLTPVPGMRHPPIWGALTRFLITFKYAVVPLALGIYSFAWYWWILSVITYIPVAYAQYAPQIQGLLFIGLILGTLLSEILCSGTLSDWLVVKLAKRNAGVRTAEMRLWLAYPAALLSAIGLVIWGISIDRGYHWIVGQIAFFLFGAGIQMGNTVVAAYVVDCYPLQSMAMVTFYAVILNLSAFVNPFFIVPWVDAVGYTWTFAAQGIITFFVSVPALAALHFFGARIRGACGQPGWVNPEYDALL
ncbi:major facilitator superfamily transporter [Pseudovirgaria hyperparasitica]|uniref:Major facilitator superfamily transporter n=1 Tax=Pseudovirgaria hyperparasitica TaxID=470096 RepID=A0A6A6WIV6_9PEZI|nr:major facilitator superfamily transporter [Pseudovirgaria hyperparasitica]KAF2762094.1 major facilitator superfamily transporter [Pseudovirgaria hyperparasitica]